MLTRTDRERSLLGEIDRFLERQHGETPTLTGVSGHIEVPEPLVDVLKEASRLLARDGAVAALPVDTQLTPSQAADILNISRHSVDQLLRHGILPSAKVGTRRRVTLSDLVAYKRRRDEQSRRALDELSELSQELGVYS